MLDARPFAIRLIAGALIGVAAWIAVTASLPFTPLLVRFLIAWLAFTFGPGFAIAGYLTRDLDPLRRVIILLGVGSAATPALIDGLGRAGFVQAFPFAAFALCGSGLLVWRCSSSRVQMSGRDLAACVVLIALAVALGGAVFAKRLVES